MILQDYKFLNVFWRILGLNIIRFKVIDESLVQLVMSAVSFVKWRNKINKIR